MDVHLTLPRRPEQPFLVRDVYGAIFSGTITDRLVMPSDTLDLDPFYIHFYVVKLDTAGRQSSHCILYQAGGKVTQHVCTVCHWSHAVLEWFATGDLHLSLGRACQREDRRSEACPQRGIYPASWIASRANYYSYHNKKHFRWSSQFMIDVFFTGWP